MKFYPAWVPDWFINGPEEGFYWVVFLLAFLWVHIMIHLQTGLLGRHREDPEHGRRHRHVRMEFRLPVRQGGRRERVGRGARGQRPDGPIPGP